MTVVDRGSDGEVADFKWLLLEVMRAGQLLPGLDDEDAECIIEAGGTCLGRLDRLVLFAVFDDGSILPCILKVTQADICVARRRGPRIPTQAFDVFRDTRFIQPVQC